MTTEIDLTEEQRLFQERAAVALIPRIMVARTEKSTAERIDRDCSAQLKQYLDLEGLQELIDGEHNLRAYYEPRSAGKYDVRSMPDALVLWLARQGLLGINVTALRALKKAAPAIELDDAERFWIPEYTTALKVEIIK